MKRLILFITIIFTLTVSCSTEELVLNYEGTDFPISYSTLTTTYPQLISTKEEALDVSKVIAEFEDSRALDNLQDVKLFWIEEDVFLDFYLSENAKPSDIQSCIDYFTRVFINEKTYGLGPDDISLIMESKEMKDRVLRVFINEVLFIQTGFKGQNQFGLNIDYFENHLMYSELRLDSRQIKDSLNNEVLEKTKLISVMKTYKPFTYIATYEVKTNKTSEIDFIYDQIYQLILTENVLEQNKFENLIINISKSNKIIESSKLYMNEEGEILFTDVIW